MVLYRVVTCLVGRKAESVVHSHFKGRVRLLETHDRRTTQIAVRIVAVAKSQAVHAPVALVVRCAIVKKSPDGTTLDASQSWEFV